MIDSKIDFYSGERMSENLNEFKSILTKLYLSDPCSVLPNPLWKTFGHLTAIQTDIKLKGDNVTKLQAFNQREFMVYWSSFYESPDIREAVKKEFRLVVINQKYESFFDKLSFPIIMRYFRLKHSGAELSAALSSQYYFEDVNTQKDCLIVSDFIGRCYENIKPSEKRVKSWTETGVFDNSLWLWIKEKGSGIPIALGIGERDTVNGEGSLEYIQVDPAFRGKGICKALVNELVHRLYSKISIVTVSGDLYNISNCEAVYRKCNFEGDNVWSVLKK